MTAETATILNFLISSADKHTLTLLLIVALHGQVERLRRRVEKMRNEINDCRTRLSKIEDKEKQKANDTSPV